MRKGKQLLAELVTYAHGMHPFTPHLLNAVQQDHQQSLNIGSLPAVQKLGQFPKCFIKSTNLLKMKATTVRTIYNLNSHG
jgi:hypothetical protein